MPTIHLSDSAFAKLKTIAEPLVDTAESVIDRIIDEAVARREVPGTAARAPQALGVEAVAQFEADAPPNLTFTKVRSARVGGVEIHRPKWNSVLVNMHLLALSRLGSLERLISISSARLRPGRYEADGFKYEARGDFSIQGVDANLCWSHSLRLAREVQAELEVVFEWREKADPACRGKVAMLWWSRPPNSRRPRGLAKGQIQIAADFDAPLPAELVKEFE